MRGADEVTDYEDEGPYHQRSITTLSDLISSLGLTATKTVAVVNSELPTRDKWGRPGAWAGSAACRDSPDVNFFPDLDRKARRELANAKAICAACPVRQVAPRPACTSTSVYGAASTRTSVGRYGRQGESRPIRDRRWAQRYAGDRSGAPSGKPAR